MQQQLQQLAAAINNDSTLSATVTAAVSGNDVTDRLTRNGLLRLSLKQMAIPVLVQLLQSTQPRTMWLVQLPPNYSVPNWHCR